MHKGKLSETKKPKVNSFVNKISTSQNYNTFTAAASITSATDPANNPKLSLVDHLYRTHVNKTYLSPTVIRVNNKTKTVL